MIHIKDLRLSYTDTEPVLENLQLHLEKGGIYALAAPNGEGKTSLLKSLAGLRFPDAGQLSVLGFEPAKREVGFLQQLYFLPSEPSLPAWSPAKIGHIYGAFYPNFSKIQYEKLLDDFKITPNKSMKNLSFGQQRRVQLAFALAVKTPILLLDEPTLGLDIAGKDQFRRSLIQATEEGQLVIIATHLLMEIEPVLEELLILHQRQIWSQISLSRAAAVFSYHLSSRPPVPDTNSYGRRVPGGWLIIKADGSPSTARPDIETLYLGLTEGNLVDPSWQSV